MTSSVNFLDSHSTTPMGPKLYVLWAQANVLAGYRYSVEARLGSESVSDGVAMLPVTWTTFGSAAATERVSRIGLGSGSLAHVSPPGAKSGCHSQ